jgi:hypothetical protein
MFMTSIMILIGQICGRVNTFGASRPRDDSISQMNIRWCSISGACRQRHSSGVMGHITKQKHLTLDGLSLRLHIDSTGRAQHGKLSLLLELFRPATSNGLPWTRK